jgi:hypothetical protein
MWRDRPAHLWAGRAAVSVRKYIRPPSRPVRSWGSTDSADYVPSHIFGLRLPPELAILAPAPTFPTVVTGSTNG